MSNRYVVLADSNCAPGPFYSAGTILDDAVVDIGALIHKGVPLSPYYEELAARASSAISLGAFAVAPALMIMAGDERPLSVASDGAIHIYVNPTAGSNSYTGMSSVNSGGNGPYATINTAARRLNQWLALGLDIPAVVELASGVYNEHVKFFLGTTPKKPLTIRGNKDALTDVFGGAAGSQIDSVSQPGGAGNLKYWNFNKSGMNLTALDEGNIVRIWDNTNKAATETYTLIHTVVSATAFRPARSPDLTGVTLANWRFQVLTPSVIIRSELSANDPTFNFRGAPNFGKGAWGCSKTSGNDTYILQFLTIESFSTPNAPLWENTNHNVSVACQLTSGVFILNGVKIGGDSTVFTGWGFDFWMGGGNSYSLGVANATVMCCGYPGPFPKWTPTSLDNIVFNSSDPMWKILDLEQTNGALGIQKYYSCGISCYNGFGTGDIMIEDGFFIGSCVSRIDVMWVASHIQATRSRVVLEHSRLRENGWMACNYGISCSESKVDLCDVNLGGAPVAIQADMAAVVLYNGSSLSTTERLISEFSGASPVVSPLDTLELETADGIYVNFDSRLDLWVSHLVNPSGALINLVVADSDSIARIYNKDALTGVAATDRKVLPSGNTRNFNSSELEDSTSHATIYVAD